MRNRIFDAKSEPYLNFPHLGFCLCFLMALPCLYLDLLTFEPEDSKHKYLRPQFESVIHRGPKPRQWMNFNPTAIDRIPIKIVVDQPSANKIHRQLPHFAKLR